MSGSERQHEVEARIDALAAEMPAADLRARDRAGEFSREAWLRCAGAGLLRLTVPVEHDGLGMSACEATGVMECFGRRCEDAGLVFAVNSVLWSCVMPLVWFGSERQRAELLPKICDGTAIAAHAMTEPGSGSDALALTTVASPARDGYRLSGRKALISNAPVADFFLVYARHEQEPGPFGISVFLVRKGMPGLTVGQPLLGSMGLRTASFGSIELAGCAVEEADLLGPRGGGVALFSRVMEWERGCIMASGVGVMERQIARCTARARERHQYGAPIGANQAISHRLADMRVRADASRLLIDRWARARDAGRQAAAWSSAAKLFASESLIQCAASALEIFGGEGYLDGEASSRELRDAYASRVYGGTSELQRNLIARDLGLL